MPHSHTENHKSSAPNDVYVGRQPIFDRQLNVYAYELLYRSRSQASLAQGAVDGEQATTTTIINTFMEIGLDRLVLNKRAAINLTEAFLLDESRLPFHPDKVILEILESVEVTPQIIAAVERLVKAGYTIALDDYLYNPAHKPLLHLAHIVKIDIQALSRDEVRGHVNQLSPYQLKLLAEKIETPDEFLFCSEL